MYIPKGNITQNLPVYLYTSEDLLGYWPKKFDKCLYNFLRFPTFLFPPSLTYGKIPMWYSLGYRGKRAVCFVYKFDKQRVCQFLKKSSSIRIGMLRVEG